MKRFFYMKEKAISENQTAKKGCRITVPLSIVLFCTAFLFLCGILLFIIISNRLKVTHYIIRADIVGSIRVVQLTDLHNAEFGEKNRKLVSLVAEQQPDIIIMTGDMLVREDPNTEIVTDLIRSMAAIAPVYFGYGNHESRWERIHSKSLVPILTDAGAYVLNNSFVDVEINGQMYRIGGYMGYYRQPYMMTGDEDLVKVEKQFFEDFEDTEYFKILLNHIPTQWVDWKYINKYPVDLVFSGHYHGGQMVLPFIGPVYAPYIGYDPPNVKGVFEGEMASCILSTGLGNERWWLPRINNPPEIVVADITSG